MRPFYIAAVHCPAATVSTATGSSGGAALTAGAVPAVSCQPPPSAVQSYNIVRHRRIYLNQLLPRRMLGPFRIQHGQEIGKPIRIGIIGRHLAGGCKPVDQRRNNCHNYLKPLQF